MYAEIVHEDKSEEFSTDERCSILELWNRTDDKDVSIARARVKPGVTTQPHVLDGIMERYLIVSGSGVVHIEGLPCEKVDPGDLVFIPAGAVQWIENTGSSDLVFYAICTPRFVSEAYHDRSRG